MGRVRHFVDLADFAPGFPNDHGPDPVLGQRTYEKLFDYINAHPHLSKSPPGNKYICCNAAFE